MELGLDLQPPGLKPTSVIACDRGLKAPSPSVVVVKGKTRLVAGFSF